MRPGSVEELTSTIEQAARDRVPVIAVGGQRATSDVSRPAERGIAIALDRVPLDPSRWRVRGDLLGTEPRIPRGHGLTRVHAAASLRDVLAALEREGRTLAAVPADDLATVAGAVATGDHGSGMIAGPLADSVAAIELVTASGGTPSGPRVRHVRIEPRNGIGIARGDLLQDDDLFRSAVVSMGCAGAVTALTLVTVPAFALEERRELVPWSALRDGLVARARAEDFLELTLLPDARGADLCLVRSRSHTDAADSQLDGGGGAQGGRALLEAAAARRIHGPSSRVLRTRIGPTGASSTEMVVDLERAVAAIDATLSCVRGGALPIAVRFTRASRAYLAMQYGRESCAIEVSVAEGESPSALMRFERMLLDPRIGGRPHWGRSHTVAGGFVDHYPKAARWRASLRRLGAGSVFESAFSRRLSIRA